MVPILVDTSNPPDKPSAAMKEMPTERARQSGSTRRP
jgi:hypothetical protein